MLLAACSKEPVETAAVTALKAVQLTGEDLSIVNFETDCASFDFKLMVMPSDAAYTSGDFAFRLESGETPEYVNFTIKGPTAGGLNISVADDGTYEGSTPYRHSVVIVYKPANIVSPPFVVTKLQKEQQRQFSLSLEEIPETLKVGESAELKIAVNPASEVLDGEKFRLLTDKDVESKYVGIEYTGNFNGIYKFNLKDKRSAYEKYSETLKVVYVGTGEPVSTQTFNISSSDPGSVSKMYITLENGLTRQKDLDSKKNTLHNYDGNNPNFEAQYTTDEREWVDAKVRIEAAGDFEDLEEMTTKIKGRGNSTWSWPKKPYNLKLDSKSKVLGMKKHKRWCLIANIIDRTHLRNWLAYNISRQMSFDYAVHGEFVELYFVENGKEDYRGLYFLTEHIKEDKDSRVPLTEVKETKTGVAGDQIGFLLEFDMNYDEPGRFLTTTSRLPVNIKYPAQEDWEDAGNMEQYNIYKKYISDYINEVDKLINNLAEGGNSDAIWEKLDIESMANFWIVFETMCNHEILWPKSVYFHKEVGEKLKAGPTWDFDYETLNSSSLQKWLNYPGASVSYQYWGKKSGGTWWAQLLKKDAKFRAEVKKQWAVIYPKMQTIQSTEIDKMKTALKEADGRNAEMWSHNTSYNPNSDKAMSFDSAISTLKSNFKTRIDWLNTQINSMK